MYLVVIQETRGAALGVFNWGIYTGYSLTFLLVIAEKQLSWRAVYWIAGLPGIVLGIIILITVREPARGEADDKAEVRAHVHNCVTQCYM